jgi:serine/threonine protein kinase
VASRGASVVIASPLRVVRGHGAIVLPDGRRAFLKLGRGDGVPGRFAVERVALGALSGLAVPEVIAMSTGRGVGLDFIVEANAGDPLHAVLHRRGPAWRLGVWLFCVEQLVAFRRHQLLYTDVKCANLVARAAPLRVVIVDFDHVVPLVGRRDWSKFGATRGYDPPELRGARGPREASCVYQLGMLLVHFLTGADNRWLSHARRGLPRLKQMLGRIGAGAIADVVVRCVDDDPARRPRDYEAVRRELAALPIPARSRTLWLQLRAEFSRRLDDVGLADLPGAWR